MRKDFLSERTGNSLLLAGMGELNLREEQIPIYEEVLEKFPKKKYCKLGWAL